MKKTFFALLALIIISLTSTVACSGGGADEGAVATSVKLSKVSLNIMIGETYQLESEIIPTSEADQPITWTSTNPAVATCEDGLVTALSAGTTIIKAKTATSADATCTVTVKNKPLTQEEMAELVKFDMPTLPLWVNYTDPESGKSSVIKVIDSAIRFEESTDYVTGTGIIKVSLKFITEKIYDSDFIQGENASYVKLKLTTPEKPEKDNDGIFEFTFAGETALRVNEGTGASSSMDVKSNEIGILFGVSDYKTGRSFKVEILGANKEDVTDYDPSPASITLSNKSLTLYPGEVHLLSATVTPEGSRIKWNSSDESVVTCTDGKMVAISEGSAIITATCGNVSADCVVIVREKVPEITLSSKSLYIVKGESCTLIATTGLENADIIWQSSDESIVTCEGGVVTAISAGSAFVTAKVGTASAECFIVVTEKTEEVEIALSHKSLYIEKGKSYTLTAASTFPEATIVWESTDENYVTCVDGKVYGVEMGEAMVIARCGNAIAYCTVKVIDPERMVTVSLTDLPFELDYIDPKTGNKSTFVITECEVIRALDYREGAGDFVAVTMKFKVKKIYDEAGDDAVGNILFRVSLSEPGIGHLETETIGETKATVGGEYVTTYMFGARFFEGRRNFTVDILPVINENN